MTETALIVAASSIASLSASPPLSISASITGYIHVSLPAPPTSSTARSLPNPANHAAARCS